MRRATLRVPPAIAPRERQRRRDELMEIACHVFAGADDAISSIARADDAAVSRLRRLIVAYVRYVTDHQPATIVWLHDLNSLDPVRGQVIRERDEHNRRRLVELITRAQQEGGVHPDADPHLVVFALLGSLNWVHRWFQPHGASAEEIGQQFSAICLRWSSSKPEATGP